MRARRPILAAVVTGAIAGAVVLGLAGRAAMAAIAVTIGSPANLSLLGVVEVVAVGAILGAAGGLLALLARKLLPGTRAGRVVLVAAILFGFSLARGRVDWSAGEFLVPTLAAAALIFLVYAAAEDLLLGRYAAFPGGA